MTSKISKALVTLAIGVGLTGAAAAQAPTWTAEQTAVWKVVSQSWADEAAQNGKWPGSYVDDNVISWSQENPMPNYKDSLIKWSRFNESQRGTDKPDRDVNAIIETLVRDGNSWKFLSTSSFSLKK
jgi:hypothetical protein